MRLLTPLAQDLREWRMASGRPADRELIFPAANGGPWSTPAYQSWRRRAFGRAVKAAGLEHAHPYACRHTYASLLLHEGRSVVYAAGQLGHDANLTLSTYAHTIAEFEDSPRLSAEAAIQAAREGRVPAEYPQAVSGGA